MRNGKPRAVSPLGRNSAATMYIFFAMLLAGFVSQPAANAATKTQQEHQYQQQKSSSRHERASNDQQAASADSAIRLEDLERMALQGNPTLAQAEAAIRAAEGRRVQAGLLPNPIVGYTGE